MTHREETGFKEGEDSGIWLGGDLREEGWR